MKSFIIVLSRRKHGFESRRGHHGKPARFVAPPRRKTGFDPYLQMTPVGRRVARTSSGIRSAFGLAHRDAERAGTRRIVEQPHRHRPRIGHRLVGHRLAAVVVPLPGDALVRADDQPQPVTRLDQARDKGETVEIIAQRRLGIDQLLGPQPFAIARASLCGSGICWCRRARCRGSKRGSRCRAGRSRSTPRI